MHTAAVRPPSTIVKKRSISFCKAMGHCVTGNKRTRCTPMILLICLLVFVLSPHFLGVSHGYPDFQPPIICEIVSGGATAEPDRSTRALRPCRHGDRQGSETE